MKLILVISLIILGAATSALASDLEMGLRAYHHQDYKTALKKLMPLAKKGSDKAQLYLGLMYSRGEGVKSDKKKAYKWFELATKKGNAEAQLHLAYKYWNKKHGAEAIKWFTLSAEQGEMRAQRILGDIYSNGRGVPQDYIKAIALYRKAAEQGDDYSQLTLGRMYANGFGEKVDFDQAEYWYRKAMDRKVYGASYSLWGIGRRGIEEDEKVSSNTYDCGKFKITIDELLVDKPEEHPDLLASRMTIMDTAGKSENVMRIRSGGGILKPKCEDINNDGIPELIFQTGYLWADCCFTQYIYELKEQPKLIYSFELGNARVLNFQDINSDGVKEIIAGEDRSADWSFCYTCSPWLEYVFCSKDGKYQDCTMDFPFFIKDKLKAHKDSLDKELKNKNSNKDLLRDALGVWGNALLLGEGNKWWKYLKTRLPAEDYKWLKKNKQEFEEAVRERLANTKIIR